jgi:hypothetical protein
MKPAVRARRIRLIDRKLGKERAVGQAHHGENLIEIDPRQRSRDRLDTLCHEVIHLLGPHLSEETVIGHANILSDALWRDRWRRIES